jgi:hypothetical protein
VTRSCIRALVVVVVVVDVVVEALGLCDQGAFQDHLALLVALVLLRRKLVLPAELGVAVLAGDVADHVPAGEHDPVLHLAVLQVHHAVEEERAARGSREACRDELSAIRQRRLARPAREQTGTAEVIEEDTAHAGTVI